MASEISINSTQVRQLLKLWDSTAKLGLHRLAELDCVTYKLKQHGQGDTDINRGMALKEILHEAIQTLRPSDAHPQVQDKAWYAYMIITERYCFGRLPEWIMVHLSISSRSFYREMRKGTDDIVSFLKHAEHEAQARPVSRKRAKPALRQVCLPPNLPPHPVIGRQAIVDFIVEKMARFDSQRIALHGLPGVGKTTIASILIDQKEIERYFSSQAVWVNLGVDVDHAAVLGRLAAYLGIPDQQIRNSSISTLTDLIQAELADGKRLIVFDDVWQIEDVQPLCLGGRQTTYLITTRQPAVGVQFAGANAITIPELDSQQGEVLLSHLAPSIFDNEPDALQTVHETTGGLPLALIIFGRYLQSQGYHGQKRRFRAAIDRLRQREARLALTLKGKDSDTTLATLIDLSLENLSAEARQAFPRLTIFQPKPNHFSQDAAVRVALCSEGRFYELVDSGLVESLGDDRYTLHQLVYDVGRPEKHEAAVVESFLGYTVSFTQVETDAFNHLQIEQVNVQTAIELALQSNEVETVSTILFKIIDFLLDRGQSEIAGKWVTQSLSIDQADKDAQLVYCHGRIADRNNEWDQALIDFAEAAKLGQEQQQIDVMIRSQIAALRLCLNRGMLDKAGQLAEAVRQHIDLSDNLVWQGNAHRSLCAFYYFQGRYQQAFEHILKTQQCFEEVGYSAGMGAVLQNLGVLSLELGRLDSAASYYERALAKYREAGSQVREGQILNNMGVLAVRKGQWLRGFQLHQQALQLRQEIDDQDGQGQSINNLSVAALAQKDVVQAQAYIEQGMVLAKAQGTRFREASLTMNCSTLATIQHDYRGALNFAQQAYQLATEINRESTLEESATEQGKLHLLLGELDQADEWLQTGRKLCLNQDLSHQLAMVNVYLAKLKQLQNKPEQAETYLAEALVILDESIDGLDDPIKILQICFEVLDRLGDEKKASRYKQKAIVALKQQSQEIADPAVRTFFVNTYK